jgi:hypothetical protein
VLGFVAVEISSVLGEFDHAATAIVALKAGLKRWRGRLVRVISSLAAFMPPLRGKSTYPGCSVFPNHLYGGKNATHGQTAMFP